LVSLRRRAQLGEIGVDVRIILKCISKKYDVRVWSRFIYRKVGTNGGLL
jgi:hypothetical protein